MRMQRCWSHHWILLMFSLACLIIFVNLRAQWSSFLNQFPEQDVNSAGRTGQISNSKYQFLENLVNTNDRFKQISKDGNVIPDWAIITDDNTGKNVVDRNENFEWAYDDSVGQNSNGRNEIHEQAVSVNTVGDTEKDSKSRNEISKHAVNNDSAWQTKAGDTHMILIWHWPIYENAFSLEGDFCKEHFSVSNCIMVANRSLFPEADLVIFHNLEMTRTHEALPVNLTRPAKQRWIWFTREGPMHNGDVRHLNGYFNLTMTYRRDADIYTPYGIMVPKSTVSGEPVENFIPKNKTKLACWVVSNFKPKHLRTSVYHKLKTVIPIEVYGKASNRSIDKKDLIPTISHCYFYLTFENSAYKDYITEKLWYNAYMSGAVPVVLGPSRKDYEAVADKDSFIHVNDFKTVEELGEFLKELAQDKKRYASYFNWRRKYNAVRKYWTESICKFCPKLSSQPPHKVYEDLDTWQRL